MSLTIVTVAHRSGEHLERLLASVRLHAPNAQVVVVDTSPEGADARHADVSLPDNPGFGAANNAGIERARHDVTALLNPDVELRDDGLLRLAAAARGRDALHVPRLVGMDGRTQDTVHPLPGSAAALLRAALPGPLRRRVSEHRPGWAIAAAVVARTATLRALGPFDPEAFLFFEDLDLCLRARERGVPLTLHHDVTLTHAGGHSTGEQDVAEQVARRRAVVEARLGERTRRRDDRAHLLEHGLRAWRARDRAYVRALRRIR